MLINYILAFSFSAVAAPLTHPCAADALKKADALLKLHYEEPDIQDYGIENKVTKVGTVKALVGKGHFDVLEVWGYIYKAQYRMHFLYAQIPGTCALMGQEILEASDPY